MIRAAESGDAPRLREIAAAAKGHWGYDEERVRSWAAEMELVGEVIVAEVDGAVVAWAALLATDEGTCVLDDLWVEPAWMGRGIGTELFRCAEGRARELGAFSVELESEPNAVGFYEKLGGRRVGERLSSWGRVLSLMRIDLP